MFLDASRLDEVPSPTENTFDVTLPATHSVSAFYVNLFSSFLGQKEDLVYNHHLSFLIHLL